LPADLGYSGNMGKRMKRANKLNARVAVILGENELAKNVAALRDLDSGEQREVPLDTLIESLAPYQ
jgi:histidyl-tRNA synthetase